MIYRIYFLPDRDVQPFVALGIGLQKRGHLVRIATHVCFRDFILENGLDYFPVGGDPAELMRFMAGKVW